MFVIVTDFSNDEGARPTTLLKTESTTDILIYQLHKFQNSCFKKHLCKAATVLQKTFKSIPQNMFMITSFKKHFH